MAPPVEQSTIEGEAPLPAFIESNTSAITLDELERDCIIPTFADLNPTISHQSFIKTITEAAAGFFSNEVMGRMETRVSHQINGRTPDAIHIPSKDLKDSQKTKFYQRICFC